MKHAAGLIFDLDNTLVESNKHYIEAEIKMVSYLQNAFPCASTEEIMDCFAAEQASMLSLPEGFSEHGFPTILRNTYIRLCEKQSAKVCPISAEDVRAIGAYVIEHAVYELYEGVAEMLQAYKEAGHPLAICSKGPRKLQHRKLKETGILHLFDHVTTEVFKTPELIKHTGEQIRVDEKQEIYMIGDSVRDDIRGGNIAGFKTVLVHRKIISETFHKIFESVHENEEATHTLKGVVELPYVVPLGHKKNLVI